MRRHLLVSGFVCATLLGMNLHSTSTTYTWQGTGTNMGTGANWNTSYPPTSDDVNTVLVFPDISYSTVNNNITSNFLFNSITFSNTTSNNYTLEGSSFLVPTGLGAPLEFTSTGNTTMSAPIQVNGTLSVASSDGNPGTNIISTLTGTGLISLTAGPLTISGGTFTGTYNVDVSSSATVATTLVSTGNNAFGTPTAMDLTSLTPTNVNAIVNLAGYSQTVGGLSGGVNTTFDLGTGGSLTSTSSSQATPFWGVVSGTNGSVSVTGGSLALMGANTYTGSTTIDGGGTLNVFDLGDTTQLVFGPNSGILQFGSDDSFNEQIILNGQATISTNGHDVTFSGAINQGSQSLVKLGSGKLTLTGSLTSSGGPIIMQGGTLNVNADSTPQGPITFESYGGTLQAGDNITITYPFTLSTAATFDTNGYTMTLNGPITAGVRMIKKGSGTLVLGGANVLSGKVVINQGTLNASSNSFSAAQGQVPQLVFADQGGTFQLEGSFSEFYPAIVLEENGTIDTQGNQITLNGVVAGGSSTTFTLMGSGGTVTLANVGNIYPGQVVLDDVTLNSGASNWPAVSGQLPTLVYDGTGDGVFQAATNFPNFASNIILNENGTIDAQTYSVSVVVNGTVALDGNKLTTLGSVTLNGGGSGGGDFTIGPGITYLNGEFNSDLEIISGGTLKGTGTHDGNVYIREGGVIAPGNSIGTITVGSLTLDSGSTTDIEIDATDASQIVVTGNAGVAGTFQVTPNISPYPHQGRYLVLTANTLNGAFDSIVQSPGFTFSLDPQGDDIYLDYLFYIPTGGLSGNALKFANYLNEYAPASNEYAALAMMTGDALEDGLERASPGRNGFGPFAAAQTLFVVEEMVYNHLAISRFLSHYDNREVRTVSFLPEAANLLADAGNQAMGVKEKNRPFEIWLSAFGQMARQLTEKQHTGFKINSEGGMIGFDYRPSIATVVGGGLGYGHTDVMEHKDMGRASIFYYFGSLYATCNMANFYLEPAFFGVYAPIENKRAIKYSVFDLKAKSYSQNGQLDTHLGFGYNATYSWGGVEPFISEDWLVNWQGSFTEHGANAINFHQKSHTSSILQSEAGLRFYQVGNYSFGKIGLREGLSYINRVPFGIGKVTAAITGSSSFVFISALTAIQNLGSVSAELFSQFGKDESTGLSLAYQGEFGSNYVSNELFFRIAKKF